jgi:hypothetical protein
MADCRFFFQDKPLTGVRPMDNAEFVKTFGPGVRAKRADSFSKRVGVDPDGVLRPLERVIIFKKSPSLHKCDGRCMNAKGHDCECSCRGANHGRGSFAAAAPAPVAVKVPNATTRAAMTEARAMNRSTDSSRKFIAKLHRYADGVAYNANRYDILVDISTDPANPYWRAIGGAIVLSDKALAFIGATSLSARCKDVIGHADAFVWGDDLRGALAKIKPQVEALKLDSYTPPRSTRR